MIERDALYAQLPPPRDDEPANLRHDILDELADHLACAYNRELLRGANPDEARQRVLNTFGDPAAVARRLWFDAMKGRIMAQRILIATCLVVTLASLSVAGIIYRQSTRIQGDSARAAAEAIRAMTVQNEQAQIGQQEMLKQLREMSEVVRSTRSLDWNPVKFHLTEETPEGPPAVGFSIALRERVPGAGPNGLEPEPTERRPIVPASPISVWFTPATMTSRSARTGMLTTWRHPAGFASNREVRSTSGSSVPGLRSRPCPFASDGSGPLTSRKKNSCSLQRSPTKQSSERACHGLSRMTGSTIPRQGRDNAGCRPWGRHGQRCVPSSVDLRRRSPRSSP